MTTAGCYFFSISLTASPRHSCEASGICDRVHGWIPQHAPSAMPATMYWDDTDSMAMGLVPCIALCVLDAVHSVKLKDMFQD